MICVRTRGSDGLSNDASPICNVSTSTATRMLVPIKQLKLFHHSMLVTSLSVTLALHLVEVVLGPILRMKVLRIVMVRTIS